MPQLRTRPRSSTARACIAPLATATTPSTRWRSNVGRSSSSSRPRPSPPHGPSPQTQSSAGSGRRGRSLSWGRADVELRLPAEGAYATVVRTTAAGLAARLDFTIDDIEDLRIAVDEACAMLLVQAVPGADLECTFELTERDLVVQVAVPTLDGPNVTLRIKPGTQPGSRHRVRGKGIETKRAIAGVEYGNSNSARKRRRDARAPLNSLAQDDRRGKTHGTSTLFRQPRPTRPGPACSPSSEYISFVRRGNLSQWPVLGPPDGQPPRDLRGERR